jgi:hypothetical protein
MQGHGSCAAWVMHKGLSRCAKSGIIYLDVCELTGVTFVRIRSIVKGYALRDTKSPSAMTLKQRNHLAGVAQALCAPNRYIIRKYSEENRIYRPSLHCSSFFRQRRHCARTSACSEPRCYLHRASTYLLQTVDNKSVVFHNWFDLCSQRT